MGTDPAAPRAARTVLSTSEIDRALTRIAHEILESNKGAEGLVLMGIPRRGAPLARRLGALLARIEPAFDPAAAVGEVSARVTSTPRACSASASDVPSRPVSTTRTRCGSVTDRQPCTGRRPRAC